MRSPRVHLDRYLEDELVAVAASSARELCGTTRAADLAKIPLLLREPGSNTRAVVEEALGRVLGSKLVRRSELLFGSNQSLKMAAVAGLGVAFLSRWSVQLEVAAGTLRVPPLRDLRIARSFSWATPSRQLHGAAGRARVGAPQPKRGQPPHAPARRRPRLASAPPTATRERTPARGSSGTVQRYTFRPRTVAVRSGFQSPMSNWCARRCARRAAAR